jgi:hypothetical protein
MNQPIDVFGCADELELKLIHEVAKEVRQASASMDKVANEVKETRDAASVRDVLLINSIKANYRLLESKDDGPKRWWINQASDPGREPRRGARQWRRRGRKS